MSSPSPVTDGRTVWVMTGTGMLKAFDFAGKELWARDIQKDYGALRHQLGLRVVAAAARGRALRPGAARDEDRRSVLRAADRQGDRQDALARRAADASARSSRPMPTPRRRCSGTPAAPRSSSPAATSSPATTRRPGKELWRADGLNPDNERQLPHRRLAARARRADVRAVARAAAAGVQGRRHAATSPSRTCCGRSTTAPTCRRR